MVILSAFGCESDGEGSGEVTDEDLDMVAQSIAPLVSGSGTTDASAMDDMVDLVAGDAPEGFSASGDGSFEGTVLGFSIDYGITCSDSEGTVEVVCSAATSDSAEARLGWEGSVDLTNAAGNGYTLDVVRSGNWSVGDFQSGSAIFSGTGTFEVTSVFTGPVATDTFVLNYTGTYAGLVYDVAGDRIVEGSITYDVSTRRRRVNNSSNRTTVSRDFNVEVEATFDDNGAFTLVVDGRRTYNLVNGEVEFTGNVATAEQ